MAKRHFLRRNEAKGKTTLSDGQILLSGSVAGVANGFVSGPVEHIRIRERLFLSMILARTRLENSICTRLGLQTQSATAPVYSGPFDAVRKIYGGHGIAGIYKGQAVTFLREAAGYGVYFLTYERLVQHEMKKGIQRNEINLGMSIAYGATAGYAVSFTNPLIQCLLVI